MTDRLLQMFWHEVDTRTGGGRRFADRLHMTQRAGWTMRSIDVDQAYQPLGVDGEIRRSIMHMEALAELLRSRGIGLTVAVYPWPFSSSMFTLVFRATASNCPLRRFKARNSSRTRPLPSGRILSRRRTSSLG